tara:strand:+ start:39 stop:893 length:855 start_codon:yes stop_codon:yes gene_type:complete
MKFYNSQRIGQPLKSWKDENLSDTKNIFIAKNVLNNDFKNSNNCTPWNNCESKTKYKFNANPLKHYRKQYVLDSKYSFSNNSYIGILDKPGSYIVSDKSCDSSNNTNMYVHILGLKDECSPQISDKIYDPSLNRTICIASNPQSLVIKRANTKLDNNYCSSQKEYIYKKCKTFEQNLPSNNDITINNGTFTNCDSDDCRTTFNPSNRRYQVQGPVTSSSRIASLKYGYNNEKNKIYSDYNNPNLCPPNSSLKECKNRKILSRPHCIGCPNDSQTIRRKKINILK